MAMYAGGSTGGCYSSFPRPSEGFPALKMAVDEPKKISTEDLEKNIKRLTLPVKRPELPKNPDGSWKDLTPRKKMTSDQMTTCAERLYTEEIKKREMKKQRVQKQLEQKNTGKKLSAEDIDACNERLCRGELEKMHKRSEHLRSKYANNNEQDSPRKGGKQTPRLARAEIEEQVGRLYTACRDEKKLREQKLMEKYVFSKEAPKVTRSRAELAEQADRLLAGRKH